MKQIVQRACGPWIWPYARLARVAVYPPKLRPVSRPVTPCLSAQAGVALQLRRLASVAAPFLAVLPIEYRAPIEMALMMLFPSAG